MKCRHIKIWFCLKLCKALPVLKRCSVGNQNGSAVIFWLGEKKISCFKSNSYRPFFRDYDWSNQPQDLQHHLGMPLYLFGSNFVDISAEKVAKKSFRYVCSLEFLSYRRNPWTCDWIFGCERFHMLWRTSGNNLTSFEAWYGAKIPSFRTRFHSRKILPPEIHWVCSLISAKS